LLNLGSPNYAQFFSVAGNSVASKTAVLSFGHWQLVI
jgi:hypothetical protein